MRSARVRKIQTARASRQKSSTTTISILTAARFRAISSRQSLKRTLKKPYNEAKNQHWSMPYSRQQSSTTKVIIARAMNSTIRLQITSFLMKASFLNRARRYWVQNTAQSLSNFVKLSEITTTTFRYCRIEMRNCW